MEIVRRPHATHLVEWARSRPEVLVLTADLTSSCEANDFQQAYPERYFSMGMAEQNMMSAAGGLAREGLRPFVHTFAVFITRRAYDQVAMSIAYPNLPVRMLGFLPGITTPGGVTHQAIDDVGMMRLLPNMRVLVCGDATDVESVLDVADAIDGPVYISMLRGEVPRLFAKDQPMVFGQARELSGGDDLVILSSGICTEEAMRASAALAARGVAARHLHVSTLKPFDDPRVVAAIEEVRAGVITMENHSIIGGLGSAVAELMAERGLAKRLVRMGLKDTFAHGASRPYLMKKYGLDAEALVAEVEGLLGRELNIGPDDLAAVRLEAAHSSAKAEAL